MIFVTVGTQLPFDRLVEAVDEWAGSHPDIAVRAQVNGGSYVPRSIDAVKSLSPSQFAQCFAQASLVVAHAGMGTIIPALDVGKPLVLLPRLASLGEHRNDHQVGTARHFARFACIRVAESEHEIGRLIDELLQITGAKPDQSAAPGVSRTLLEGIKHFLDDVARARHLR
jgi:UDP-N-acetylglucosamine transferase subunit ALG13